MGTTSQKLTYLNTTKQLLKTEINKINNVLTDNSTFRSYPQELFNGYLDVLNNGTDTLWSNLEKVSQTGTEAVLEGVETAPMKIELNGNTSQDGTPTPDTPVEVKVVKGENVVSVSGKNLFKEWISASINPNTGEISATPRNLTDKIFVKSNTTYTMWKEDTGFAMYAIEFDKDDNYLATSVIVSADTTRTFTTNANTSYVRLYQYIVYSPTNKAQLELGSTATDYVPYSKTDYPINLNANMFDPTQIPEGNFGNRLSTTGTLYGDVDYFVSNRIPIQPNTEYEVNWTPEAKKRICFYSSSLISSFISSNDTESIFKTPNNATYMRFSNLTSEISNLSVKPKNNLELCKINTYKDYIYKNNGKWYVHKEIEKMVLDGTENWIYQDEATTPTPRTVIRLENVGLGSNLYFSSHFIKDSSSSNRIVFLTAGGGTIYLSLDNTLSGIDTTDDSSIKVTKIKTWLSNNNVTLYYVLATPTETEITDTTLIEQLDNLSKAKSVKDKTYITQTNDDLPFILDVNAIKEYEVN